MNTSDHYAFIPIKQYEELMNLKDFIGAKEIDVNDAIFQAIVNDMEKKAPTIERREHERQLKNTYAIYLKKV